MEVFETSEARLRERQSEKWRKYPPDVLPTFIAEMDVRLAPPIEEALLRAVRLGDTGYAVAGELGEAFSEFAARRFGWQVDPKRCFLVPDVMAGIAEALRIVTAPGDRVVINPPVYPPFYYILREVGRSPVEVPIRRSGDRWQIDLSELEAAYQSGARIHLLCSPHNPVGKVFTLEELSVIADLAARYGVRVISDEIHAPLVLPGAPGHTPFGSLEHEAAAQSITSCSASKAFNIAGLKCALLVAGSDEVARELRRLPIEIPYRAGLFGVIAAIAAFREGDAWLATLLSELDANRRLLGELLERELPQVGYVPPQASYLAWLDMRDLGMGNDPAKTLLQKARLAAGRGSDFGPGGEGHIRINFATPPALLEETVSRIRSGVQQYA
jgi:cystathionine beta-lyase